MSEKKKGAVYISGQITGNPNWREEFAAAERRLEGEYERVVNPLRLSDKLETAHSAMGLPPPTWADYLKNDIRELVGCEYMAQLPNYQQSKGALLEFWLAINCDIKVVSL